MQTRSSLFAASLLCLNAALYPDSQTVQIPEGKLTSHPSLFGDITPSAGPRVIDGYGVYLTGDYLYWTAREDDLDFAVSGAGSSTGPLLTERGKKFSPGYRFQSGFRGGIGFDFGHDKWDLYMDYTWFNTNSNTKSASATSSLPLTNLIPMGGVNNLFSALNSAKGLWDLRFNVIDIDLGRNFYISKSLSLRPFFGAKGTWQKQIYNIHYNFATGQNIVSNNKNNYWAIGILTGVNTTWHLPGTWSMFADLGLSTLWGAFKVKRTDKNQTGSYYETKNAFHTIKPVLELGAGIRKEQWFYNDRFHFSMQAGWEQQIWFSQNQFDFYTSPRQGDMNIQGFTAKVRFDF